MLCFELEESSAGEDARNSWSGWPQQWPVWQPAWTKAVWPLMLTERYPLYCREQVQDGKYIDFPRQPSSSSWLVCYLDLPELEAMRCMVDPREVTQGRETAILVSHSQTCPVPRSTCDWNCWLSSPALLLRPTPYTFTTQLCVFCSFTLGDRHWWRAWFVVPQSAFAVAGWLAEGEMLWCLPAMGCSL